MEGRSEECKYSGSVPVLNHMMVFAGQTCKVQSSRGISSTPCMDSTEPPPTSSVNSQDTGKPLRGLKHLIPLNLEHRSIEIPSYPFSLIPMVLRLDDSPKISTTIVHLGQPRQAGHCRVAAFFPEERGLWYSDDNQPAQKLERLTVEIKEQCYVLGCLIR